MKDNASLECVKERCETGFWSIISGTEIISEIHEASLLKADTKHLLSHFIVLHVLGSEVVVAAACEDSQGSHPCISCNAQHNA